MPGKTGGSYVHEPDDPSQRLISLTLALIHSEYGLTKEEIYSSIRGYRDDLAAKANRSAIDKKFERDKDILRSMGVQIEAAGSSEGDADYRYKISREIYNWPKGASLTSKQLQLLELAASVWDKAALSSAATNAITRIKAIADPKDSAAVTGLAPRISTVEPCFSPLKKAIEELVQVKFKYRKADGTESVREVQPWQLSHTQGLWILIGWDVARKAPRNFLLKRIHSEVTKQRTEFEKPKLSEINAAKKDLDSHFKKNVATIKVAPGTTAAMHFESHKSKTGEIDVHYLDLQLLADELIEFGNAVSVVKPAELSEVVRETLKQVIRNHA